MQIMYNLFFLRFVFIKIASTLINLVMYISLSVLSWKDSKSLMVETAPEY